MKRFCVKALSLAALSVLGGAAAAQQPTVNPAPTPATLMPAQGGCGGCGAQWTAPGGGNCGGCQDDCCHRGGLYLEASILLVKPRWDNNEAYSRSHQAPNGLGTLDNSTVSNNFDMDLDWMPRLAIGYGFGDGFGARVRWSQGKWDQTLNASVAGHTFDTPGDRIATASPIGLLGLATTDFTTGDGGFANVDVAVQGQLHVLTWDFEATKEARICGFNVTFSGGLRYLHISQNYGVAMTSDDATGLTKEFLISGHNLNGWGPTFAIDARAPLCGGFSAYGEFRSSLIFAKGKQSAAQFGVNDLLGETVITFQKAYQERDTVIPIGELEVGGEYACSMGNSELFARAGLVGQAYFGACNSSRSGNSANELNSNLGLIGVNFTVGLRY